MATVVAVMDRSGWSANTDNIVVVDPAARCLLWVPRDLWCQGVGDRINSAFGRGGHPGLVEALAEHDIGVEHSVCLAREAVEHALDDIDITVPVGEDLAFWYPLSPREPIEDGRKIVRFRAPADTLQGERIHQWIGARMRVDGPSGDFDRIGRQQTLVRCLLDDHFEFGRALENAEWVSASDPAAYDELRRARPSWRFTTFTDVVPRRVDGKAVLIDRRHVSRARRCQWRLSGWWSSAWARRPFSRRANS